LELYISPFQAYSPPPPDHIDHCNYFVFIYKLIVFTRTVNTYSDKTLIEFYSFFPLSLLTDFTLIGLRQGNNFIISFLEMSSQLLFSFPVFYSKLKIK